MTNPDEFPPAGTWSVNQNMVTGKYFVTESQGDGTANAIRLALEANCELELLGATEFKTLLEQICARHNEALREEEG